MSRRCTMTADLLAWQPPASTEVRFADPAVTRAASRYAQLCRALSASVADSGLGREEIARRMSDYLGETYTEARLNADTAESKETHIINPIRLEAFCAATGDSRVWSLLLEPLGLAVIERRYLPCIEAAILAEKADEIASALRIAKLKVREVAR
jgi:hypothetical protein